MYCVVGNYGDDTIAVLEWLKQQAVAPVYVVSVDTGWADDAWQARLEAGQSYAKACGFENIRLVARLGFADLVKKRNCFPSVKFHWCANLLKGLPILTWLDEVDFACEATIILPKRRSEAAAVAELPEFINDHAPWGGRKTWHPLRNFSDEARDNLVQQAGFSLLGHRSLECGACIYNQAHDFQNLGVQAIAKLAQLEAELEQVMYAPNEHVGATGIKAVVEHYRRQEVGQPTARSSYYKGCGSEFGCGF